MTLNKYRQQYYKAERRLEQIITALPATLSREITTKFLGLKHEDFERVLQQLERQQREYRMNPNEWEDFAVRQLREKGATWSGKYADLQLD